MDKEEFTKILLEVIGNKPNRFHPLVWINGEPEIGENVYIGGFSEIYAKGGFVMIGPNCDIASFVAINCADSHMKTVELADQVEKKEIIIENNVFVGTHSAILGGTHIGHHSVIGAGVILKNRNIPPYSLVYRDDKGELKIIPNYYAEKS
jgi:acetyltransferase-like isoleucine patch superfamily enzyme